MRLPCGCQMWSVTGSTPDERTMIFEACSPDCEYVAYARAEAERQGKDVTEMDMRETE